MGRKKAIISGGGIDGEDDQDELPADGTIAAQPVATPVIAASVAEPVAALAAPRTALPIFTGSAPVIPDAIKQGSVALAFRKGAPSSVEVKTAPLVQPQRLALPVPQSSGMSAAQIMAANSGGVARAAAPAPQVSTDLSVALRAAQEAAAATNTLQVSPSSSDPAAINVIDPLGGSSLGGNLANNPLAGNPLASTALAGNPLLGNPLAANPFLVTTPLLSPVLGAPALGGGVLGPNPMLNMAPLAALVPDKLGQLGQMPPAAAAMPDAKEDKQDKSKLGVGFLNNPDILELFDHFQIDSRHMMRFCRAMERRHESGTFEGDMLKMWELCEQARNPEAMLVSKFHELEQGTFVGMVTPDEELRSMEKRFGLDKEAINKLTDVLEKHRQSGRRDEYLVALEEHLAVSSKPSAMVMMSLKKIAMGESLGKPGRVAPGSYRAKQQQEDRGRGRAGGRSRSRSRNGDRDRGRGNRHRSSSRGRSRSRSRSRRGDRRDRSRDRREKDRR